MTKIQIDGQGYLLDLEEAKRLGLIKRFVKDSQLKPGDVFVPYNKESTINNLLLVQTSYDNLYQLLGIGCACNSNGFYLNTHNLGEIEQHLLDKGMVYHSNINQEIYKMVADKKFDA